METDANFSTGEWHLCSLDGEVRRKCTLITLGQFLSLYLNTSRRYDDFLAEMF